MADYAGAVAAMKARFLQYWVDGDDRKTPIAFQNETPNDGAVPPVAIEPWPPQNPDTGSPIPWVYFEVINTQANIIGAGKPGSQSWLYTGYIFIHVFVPNGYGNETAQQLAVQAGEIFRAQGFYNDNAGCIVRTWAPRTEGGASDADEGNWFRVTCSIPFEFYYRG